MLRDTFTSRRRGPGKIREERLGHDRGLSGKQLNRSLPWRSPSMPSEPTNKPHRGHSRRGRPAELAEVHDRSPSGVTIDQSQHVARRRAVLEAVRAARVLRLRSRRSCRRHLAGGVGRVEQTVPLRARATELDVHDAGFDARVTRRTGIELEDLDACAPFPTVTPPATGVAPPESPVPAPRGTTGMPCLVQHAHVPLGTSSVVTRAGRPDPASRVRELSPSDS